MGLLADVYRSKTGDCTLGGVSSKAERVCLVNVDGPFSPDAETPAVMLVPGNVEGTVKIIKAVESEVVEGTWKPFRPEGMIGPMMGGNYIATSDSRFSEAIQKIIGAPFYGAVPVHDRYETSEQYRVLSA